MLVGRPVAGTFDDAVFSFIGTSEGFHGQLYGDTKSIPTIGYGYALAIVAGTGSAARLVARSQTELDTHFSGIHDFSAADMVDLQSIVSLWNSGSKSNAKTLADNHTDGNLDFSITAAEGRIVFSRIVGDLAKLGIPSDIISGLSGTKELVALYSLAYNAPVVVDADMEAAIRSGDRPGAWYEIAYKSFGTGNSIPRGVYNRRDSEGDYFGLYSRDTGPNPADNGSEAKKVVQFLDLHNADMSGILAKVKATNSAGVVTGDGLTSAQEKEQIRSHFLPAEAELISKFGAGMTIEAVTVNGVGKAGAFTLKGGGGKADLAFGEDLADTIAGGAANDILYGGKGNDALNGGIGDDVGGFVGTRAEYDIVEVGPKKFTVTHARGTREDGVDTLTDIEFARFQDQKIALGAASAGKDIALAIDLSGSMGDDLAAVKSRSLEIVNAILTPASSGLENRIGIVTFNDVGSIQAPLPFTADKQAALDSIQNLAILGGGAEPVNGALLFALQGGLGDWRENSTARKIVLFTDEAPADPELADDVAALSRDIGAQIETLAQSFAANSVSLLSLSTERLATDVGNVYHSAVALSVDSEGRAAAAVLAVDIYTVVVGSDTSAIAAGQQIADANRGLAFTAANASEVVDAILDAIVGNPNLPTPGNDVLDGTSGPDAIDALGGNDTVNGLGGNDQLIGNTGNDQLSGGDGDDRLIGNLGNDTLNGGPGTDEASWFQDGGSSGIVVDMATGTVLRGTERDTMAGIERVVGTEFTDTINGDALANELRGNGGNDTINGLGGVDNLLGEGGNDTIRGNEGNDLVYGGTDNDRLFGDAGSDKIGPGYGTDVISGGTGNDIFDINDLDSGVGRGTRDIIADFTTGDKIDITSIDAKLSVSGDQAFSFIGGNAFSAAGQLRFFRDGTVTVVEGSNDADNAPEFQLEISRVFTPVAADFLL